MCLWALVCVYALHTATSNCGNVCVHFHTWIKNLQLKPAFQLDFSKEASCPVWLRPAISKSAGGRWRTGNTWSRDGEMQECDVQAYYGSCKLSDVQDSHRGFFKKKKKLLQAATVNLIKPWTWLLGLKLSPGLREVPAHQPAGGVIMGNTKEGDSKCEKDRGLVAQRPFFI